MKNPQLHDIDSLVKTYGRKVYNLALRITGNSEDAHDVVQDTFLQVHKNLNSFRGESSIYTWIYRITVNNCLQLKRRLNREYMDSLDEKIEMFKDDVPDDVKSWEDDPEKRFLYDALLKEIRNECYYFMTFLLTDEQRIVYILRVLFSMSLDDISSILEINKNTVKARLQRAKTTLYSYFNRRCQWTEQTECKHGDIRDKSCTCASRIGFAIAYAPDILHRIRNYPHDEKTRAMIKDNIDSIDAVYRQLDMKEFETEALLKKFRRA